MFLHFKLNTQINKYIELLYFSYFYFLQYTPTSQKKNKKFISSFFNNCSILTLNFYKYQTEVPNSVMFFI